MNTYGAVTKEFCNLSKSCETCCKIKPPQKTKLLPLQLRTKEEKRNKITTAISWCRPPNGMYFATNLLGPLPETEDGNKYILVISDYFTKWLEGVAIPDQTAITVARALVKEVVCRFCTPAYLQSDQARQFEGTVYQEMFKLLGIKKP